jgi:hypothetical protein
MTIGPEWVAFDTNIWMFGLRQQPEQPACAQVLTYIPRLHVKIPRQILLELQANLRHEEMRDFFRLLHRHLGHTDIRWEQVELSRIRTYQRRWKARSAVTHGSSDGSRVVFALAMPLYLQSLWDWAMVALSP